MSLRLEQKGWIKGARQKTEPNRDAKYYSITKSGERARARPCPMKPPSPPARCMWI